MRLMATPGHQLSRLLEHPPQSAHRLEQAALAAGRNPSTLLLEDPVDEAEAQVLPVPTMFLRGAGVPGGVRTALKRACSQHGWAVVRDRRQAWHLARGKIPMVMIDFTDNLVTVGRVRAVYSEAQEPLLSRPASIELGRLSVETPVGVQMLVEAVIDSLYPCGARRA